MNPFCQQKTLSIKTQGRSTIEISTDIEEFVTASNINTGLCSVFVHHTSASIIITENADPTVRMDLETILERLAPDGDPAYLHDYEGDDDMSAHIRCMLTNDSITVPISTGKLALGTWQGVYLYEHRYQSHQRQLTVTLIGN